MDSDDDLAHELLLGITSTDANGRYHKRIYPESGSERERQARAALARLLLKEASPNDFYTLHVAALIDPSPGIERKIEFVRRPGGRRSTGRLDLEIYGFFQDQLNLDPNIKPTKLIAAAVAHFRLSDRRIELAWAEFNKGRVKTNTHV